MVESVRFHGFGGVEQLQIEDVSLRAVGPRDVLVEVRAAAINPGEASIRSGALEAMFPTTLPSGEGTDLAGVVLGVGDDVDEWREGDEVFGWSWERSSHARQVVVPAEQLIAKPSAVSWEAAGSLGVAGATAAAAVRAVDPKPSETVVVSGATGGVGTLVVQLLQHAGVRVIAVASARNATWLQAHGASLVPYGPDLVARLRAAAPNGVDALIDLHGPEYVHAGIELGVDPTRINTIIAFAAAAEVGAKAEGSDAGTTVPILAELADLIARGELDVPISATYPLASVRAAFTELEQRHTFGKIVLLPGADS